ncbi:hypothetical protein C3943_04135 [Lysinibacillus sp. B2A1]|nr:hypothetical protein C3943_04135 [Lysinibacillus sp. B2A1]
MDDIIIFGASNKALDFVKVVSEFEKVNIAFFLDNNTEKWGQIFCDKLIVPMDTLSSSQIKGKKIIVSSMYYNEIIEQLKNDKRFNNCVIIKDDLFLDSLLVKDTLFDKYIKCNSTYDKKDFIFVYPKGDILGGVEIWNENCVVEANKRSLSATKIYIEAEKLKLNNIKYSSYKNLLKSIVQKLMKHNEIVVFPNNSLEIIRAIKIMKKMGIKNKITVCSVVHVDYEMIIDYSIDYSEIIDTFICVSDEIYNKLVVRLPHRKSAMVVKITPILNQLKSLEGKPYSKIGEPVKMGYASRLEIEQKRSLDALNLIEALEAKQIEYILEIAGDGTCYNNFIEFVEKYNLKQKVILKGKLNHMEMYDFWWNQDIHLNFSDREGTSISMLEGLSRGAVPVVTLVSGVNRFIKNESFGKKVHIGDITSMAEYITYLSENKEVLRIIGENGRMSVEENCDYSNYYDLIFK